MESSSELVWGEPLSLFSEDQHSKYDPFKGLTLKVHCMTTFITDLSRDGEFVAESWDVSRAVRVSGVSVFTVED